MPPQHPTHFIVVGAGAAGLMTARELARAGKRVTILEARDRCGGRIYPLPADEFGYPAEGGAEFVHGAATVTRSVMRAAGLSLLPRAGTTVCMAGSRRATARSPSISHRNAAYTAPRSISARPWRRLTRAAAGLPHAVTTALCSRLMPRS